MSTYSKEWKQLVHRDVERYQDFTAMPPIRFLSEEPGTKQATGTVDLKVVPTGSADNTFKFRYPIMSVRTVEDLLKWKRAFNEVCDKKPLESASAQFSMVKVMLDGEAKVKWVTYESETCDTPSLETDRTTEIPPLGQTADTFLVVMRKFVKSYFKRSDLIAQLHYLRTCLKFPTTKEPGIKIKEFGRRLREINAKLNYFPKPPNYTGMQTLTPQEINYIIAKAVPPRYWLKLMASGRTVNDHTYESLIEYFNIQHEEHKMEKSLNQYPSTKIHREGKEEV